MMWFPLLAASVLSQFNADPQVKNIRKAVQGTDSRLKSMPSCEVHQTDSRILASYRNFGNLKLEYEDRDLQGTSHSKWYYLNAQGELIFVYQYQRSNQYDDSTDEFLGERHRELRCYFKGDSLLYALRKELFVPGYGKADLAALPNIPFESCDDLQMDSHVEDGPSLLANFKNQELDADSETEDSESSKIIAMLDKRIDDVEGSLGQYSLEKFVVPGDGGSQRTYHVYRQKGKLRAVTLEGYYEDSDWNTSYYLDQNENIMYYKTDKSGRYICSPLRFTCAQSWVSKQESIVYFYNGEVQQTRTRGFEDIPLTEPEFDLSEIPFEINASGLDIPTDPVALLEALQAELLEAASPSED